LINRLLLPQIRVTCAFTLVFLKWFSISFGSSNHVVSKIHRPSLNVEIIIKERTCVVFGMPKEAINCGAAEKILASAENQIMTIYYEDDRSSPALLQPQHKDLQEWDRRA
jgi:hypothetical protein